MIKIIHDETSYNDNGVITAIEIKFKSIDDDGNDLPDPALVSKIMSAFSQTTLLKDEENRGFRIENGKGKRVNVIANLIIKLGNNSLTRTDIARFIDALETGVNETKIF